MTEPEDSVKSVVNHVSPVADHINERNFDDQAIEIFAQMMKAKMLSSRDKGRCGWENPQCVSDVELAQMLIGHLLKSNAGNYVDIASLAMMLSLRNVPGDVLSQAFREIQHGDLNRKDK